MPIYEYRCERCGHEFEKMECMDRRDSAGPCPVCGRDAVQRTVSTFTAKAGGQQETAPAHHSCCGRCGSGGCKGGGW
ncbi:MAG: zinc ribbon domain-containing protein [Phycisphaerales bacterium]|nr:zinc ribbon domain-containing protein [Phycisphaerales bacterium]